MKNSEMIQKICFKSMGMEKTKNCTGSKCIACTMMKKTVNPEKNEYTCILLHHKNE